MIFGKKNILIFEWPETSRGNKPGRTRRPANEILRGFFFPSLLVFHTRTAFPSATREPGTNAGHCDGRRTRRTRHNGIPRTGTRYPSRLTLRDIISIWHRDIVTLFCVPFILRRYFFFVRFLPHTLPFPSRSPNRARGRFSASRNSISPTISPCIGPGDRPSTPTVVSGSPRNSPKPVFRTRSFYLPAPSRRRRICSRFSRNSRYNRKIKYV